MSVVVRDVVPGDLDAWMELFHAYRAFYQKERDPDVAEAVWNWVNDPWHEVRSLVAEVDGEIVGIGNYRTFSRPIIGGAGIWLDDLYTSEAARGRGVASAILARLSEIAANEGASLVRWITADDNATARSLYDKEAVQTPWITYDKAPAEEG